MTNSTYTDYPFTAKGINFISRVYSHSELAPRIANLPLPIFQQLNAQAINEISAITENSTLDEIQKELERVNEGGSHAFILLGENA